MPEVSIIIPTYNRDKILAAAISSVRQQSYKGWELIVVDDCSTDRTESIVKWEQEKCNFNRNRLFRPVIHYVQLPSNSGSPVKPRNFGASIATGKYLAFLDSDDQWYSNKLELQLWYMKNHNSEFTYHDLTVQKGNKLYDWSKMSTCHSDYVFKYLLRKNFIPTSSVMIKKDLWENYGGMDPKLTINHDWDLWLRIGYAYQIHFINEKLGWLDLHEDSVITKNHRRRVDSRKIVRKWKYYVGSNYYRKVMIYYYLMEVFDILPDWIQNRVRTIWYKQSKYK